MKTELAPNALRTFLERIRRRDMRSGAKPGSWELQALLDRDDVDTQVLGRMALQLLRDAVGRRSGSEGLAKLWELPLFHKCLQKSIVTDCAVERLLVDTRRTLLEGVARGAGPGESDVRTILSLAAQCFNNQYVYWASAEEERAVDALRAELREALQHGLPCRAHALAAYAMYAPLWSLGCPDALLRSDVRADPAMDELVVRQVQEYAEERAIKESIRSYDLAADRVSVAVREQYEQAPYPRWFTITLEEPAPFADTISRVTQDAVPFRGRTANVLVAGCGTGREPISIASKYSDVFVVAVDVSRESLAYAVRQARRYGLTNIEFIHANLLNVAALKTEFDAAIASGVLHHMASPVDGLRALAEVVRPKGLLKIAVYSRRRRADLRPFQARFAAVGDSGAAGLKRPRHEILETRPPGLLDAFEADNPGMFRSLQTFWAQKR